MKKKSTFQRQRLQSQKKQRRQTPIVYLNGRFMPTDKAKVSALDRGFLFGDGVYEVVPIYNGKPFRLEEHLMRLQNSLNAIELHFEVNGVDFKKIAAKLVEYDKSSKAKKILAHCKDKRSANQDYSLYIQITRGSSGERSYSIPKQTVPTVLVMIKPVHPISYETLRRGACVITAEDIRWQYCYIKSISLLPSLLLLQKAIAAGCDEAILIRDGYAIEGIACNVFIVKDGVIITPPLSKENLSGVTRDLILKILLKHDFAFKERKIKAKELQHADEIWISSSPRGIVPVIKLDGKKVGNGKAGAIWEKVIKLFFAYKEKQRTEG